jgi:replicative DNA helicase
VPPPPAPFRFRPPEEFDRTEYRLEWYVEDVLVRGQPGVLGGSKKSLKTSVAVDLAVSIGTGQSFLGRFPVARRARVGFLSGESGEATLQETFRRVCRARGVTLATSDVWCEFRLPQLSSRTDLAGLAAAVRAAGVEVLFLDPLYLCVLGGLGAEGLQASNMYQMGPLFLNVSQTLLPLGCTPLLVHHFKMTRADPYGEPELDDLAFSGIQEFARQWVLLGRREKYEKGSGRHKLWLATGGTAAGHSGVWALDVNEGVAGKDFMGRVWEVELAAAGQARQDDRDVKRRAGLEEQARKDAADDNALMTALDKLSPDGHWAGYNKVQLLAKLGDGPMLRAATRLQDRRLIVEAERVVETVIGNGGTRLVKGLRRVQE